MAKEYGEGNPKPKTKGKTYGNGGFEQNLLKALEEV